MLKKRLVLRNKRLINLQSPIDSYAVTDRTHDSSEPQYSTLRTSVKLDSSVLSMGLHCLLNFFSNGSLCESCKLTLLRASPSHWNSRSRILGAMNDADAQALGLQMKPATSSAVLIRAPEEITFQGEVRTKTNFRLHNIGASNLIISQSKIVSLFA